MLLVGVVVLVDLCRRVRFDLEVLVEANRRRWLNDRRGGDRMLRGWRQKRVVVLAAAAAFR